MSTDERFTNSTGFGTPLNYYDLIKIISDSRQSGFFPLAPEKEAPDDLAEYINHSDIPAGSTIMVVDQEGNKIVRQITNRFFLSSFNVNYREKAQLVETFGASTVSFFGDSIKVYNFAGNAIDYPSTDNPSRTMQQTSLIKLYDEHLRGTKLIQNKRIGVIKIFNHTVYGYPLNFSSSYNGQRDKMATFNKSWVVAKHEYNIPGLIEDEDLEANYTPIDIIIKDEATKQRLRRIEEFLEAYNNAMQYEATTITGSLIFTESIRRQTVDLANLMASLQNAKQSVIKQRIEVLVSNEETVDDNRQDLLKEGYTLLEDRFGSIIDYLIGIESEGLLPVKFNLENLKELKSSLTSLDAEISLRSLGLFADKLTKYARDLREAERIIKQGL